MWVFISYWWNKLVLVLSWEVRAHVFSRDHWAFFMSAVVLDMPSGHQSGRVECVRYFDELYHRCVELVKGSIYDFILFHWLGCFARSCTYCLICGVFVLSFMNPSLEELTNLISKEMPTLPVWCFAMGKGSTMLTMDSLLSSKYCVLSPSMTTDGAVSSSEVDSGPFCAWVPSAQGVCWVLCKCREGKASPSLKTVHTVPLAWVWKHGFTPGFSQCSMVGTLGAPSPTRDLDFHVWS